MRLLSASVHEYQATKTCVNLTRGLVIARGTRLACATQPWKHGLNHGVVAVAVFEGWENPAAFLALTLYLYVVPEVNPESAYDVTLALTVTRLRNVPPGALRQI